MSSNASRLLVTRMLASPLAPARCTGVPANINTNAWVSRSKRLLHSAAVGSAEPAAPVAYFDTNVSWELAQGSSLFESMAQTAFFLQNEHVQTGGQVPLDELGVETLKEQTAGEDAGMFMEDLMFPRPRNDDH